METIGNKIVRFDLEKSVEVNYKAYLDALEEHPESERHINMLHSQYLKVAKRMIRERAKQAKAV